MTKFGPRRVTRAVGMNPIAQAVARKQVHDSIVSTQINLHLLEEGEDWDSLRSDMIFLLLAMLRAVEQYPPGHNDEQGHRWPLRNACLTLSKRKVAKSGWVKEDLPELDAALDTANHLYKTLPASAINAAIQNLSKGS